MPLASPATMAFAMIPESLDDRDTGQQRHDSGQHDVSQEDEIVGITNCNLCLLGELPAPSNHCQVIVEVAGKKDDRDAEAGEHGTFVCTLSSSLDQQVAGDQQQSGRRIKSGIQVRKNRRFHDCFPGSPHHCTALATIR